MLVICDARKAARRCAIGPQRGPDSAISHFLYRNIGTGPSYLFRVSIGAYR